MAAQQSFPGGQATLAAKARVAEAKEEQLAVVKLQAVQRGNVVRKETEAEKERQRLLADAEARRQRVTAEMAAREAAREAALREAARAVEEVSDLDDADADSLWMEGDPAAAAAEAAAAKAATKAAAMEADAAKAAAAAFYKAAEKADAAKALAARADALKAEEEAAALKVQSLVRGHQARNAQEESRRIASLRFYVADGAYDEARKLAMTPAEEATIQQAEEEEKAAAKRAAWAKEAEEEWKRKKAAKEAKEAAEKEAAEKEAAKKNAAEKADVAKALAARAAALKAEEAAALKVQSLAAAARAAAAKVLEMQAEEESAAAKRAAWAKEAEEEWKRKKAVKEAAEREAAEKEAEKAAVEAAAAEAAAAEAAAAKAAAEETICKRQKTKIERQPEGKLLKSASSGAPRSIEEKLDYTKADASKWIFNEVVYKGAAVAVSVGQEERVQGLIRDGLRKLREEPSKYFAIKYQSNMVDWPEEHQEYRLIHREGTLGYQPQRHPDGSFTILMADYQPLPSVPKMVARDMDASTDVMTFQGYTLHHARNPPLCPGRGMGVCDMPSLKIIGDVDPSDVNQGSVGDCWLLSAISALAEFDGAVSTLFRKTPNLQSMPHEQPNKYTITLWDLATWKEVDVMVDERLASKATGDGLLGCAPSIDGELWVCYLEKAVAIHCGGWDEIDGGQCTHAWSLLTGCKEQYTIRRGPSGKFGCKGKFNPNDEVWEQLENSPQKGFRGLWPSAWPKVGGGGDYTLELDEEELFIRMCAWDDANYILAAGSKAGSDTEMTDGVVDGHAYSIIDCINDVAGTDVDLIKMRNPWGKGEIEQGQFDDDGPGWDRYPEIKAELNPVAADDGIFYVTKEEFFKYFVTVYVCAKDMSEFLNPNDEILIKAAAENAAAEKAAAEKAAAEKAAAEKAAESAIEAEAEVELRSGSRGQALPAKPVHEQPGVVPITPSHPEKQRDAALQAERHYGAGLEASKRGETARALGYFEQALNALEQAHEPERPTYLLSAGNMHLKMGEPAKALILYEKCQLACQLRPMTSTQTAILEEKMRLARDAMAAAKWAKEKRGALGSLAQGAGAGLGTLAESTLNSLTPLWQQVLGVADLFKEPKPQRYNMLRDSPADAKYKVCIVQFKVPGAKNGGLDKGFDGNRIDSIPIANGVIQAGGACDIVRFDSDKNKSDIREFELLTAKYDALIVRINQGQLSQGTPRGTQKRFDALMSKYVATGKLVLGHENQPLPPLRSEFTVGEFICSSRLAQLTTKQFQAVCGGDKTLADVPDDDYYEACVLTDTMGVKVIEMLEARLPCLNTQTSMASNGPDAEVSLLSTQERGVREVKIGSACASAAVPSAQPNSQRTLSEAASLAYLSRHPPPASTNTCCTPLHRRGPRRHARTGRCERDGQPRPQHSALREPGV